MAITSIPLLFAAALGTTAPAPQVAGPLPLAFDLDRLGAPVHAAPVDDLALARLCSDSWWTMSGIQLITCMIAHPEDTFGPSDGQS